VAGCEVVKTEPAMISKEQKFFIRERSRRGLLIIDSARSRLNPRGNALLGVSEIDRVQNGYGLPQTG